MHVALTNDIAGIPGDCGGQCACGTCHVYIDPAWVERIGSVAPGSTEEAMISGAPVDARPNSRLACQVNLTPLSDGLIVEIPEGQSPQRYEEVMRRAPCNRSWKKPTHRMTPNPRSKKR